ncbi:MAG TPA: vitamin K epoxide reductase family protein [Candidatus Paceibacterota bacterium]
MPFTATFIVLSLAGLVNAGYLSYKHFQKKLLVCPINHDCNAVVESKWGHMFGVRNEILGILYYLAMFAGILIFILKPNLILDISNYIFIGTAIGLIFSAFLTYLQKFVIKEYCFYCLISALISLLLFINSLALQ